MTRKLTNEEFQEKSIKIHGDKYIYPETYINNRPKIWIVCKKHHTPFQQKPNDHLMGHGCPKCGKNEKSDSNQFRLKSKLKHDDQQGNGGSGGNGGH